MSEKLIKRAAVNLGVAGVSETEIAEKLTRPAVNRAKRRRQAARVFLAVKAGALLARYRAE